MSSQRRFMRAGAPTHASADSSRAFELAARLNDARSVPLTACGDAQEGYEGRAASIFGSGADDKERTSPDCGPFESASIPYSPIERD